MATRKKKKPGPKAKPANGRKKTAKTSKTSSKRSSARGAATESDATLSIEQTVASKATAVLSKNGRRIGRPPKQRSTLDPEMVREVAKGVIEELRAAAQAPKVCTAYISMAELKTKLCLPSTAKLSVEDEDGELLSDHNQTFTLVVTT